MQRQPNLPHYAYGETVLLTAIPTNGYAFIGWSGNASGSQNPLPLVMDSHKNVTALFKRAGDDFVTALPLAGASVVTSGTNVSFTKEPGEPNHAGNPGGKSIWWRWTAPQTGPVRISTAGSAFATLLAVYTGSAVSNLTAVASDINSLGGTNRSQVNFNALAGTTYHIAVDGLNGASSRITLSLTSQTASVRPVLSDLVRLGNGTVQFRVTGEPNHNYYIDYSADASAWFNLGTITTAGDGRYDVSDSTAGAAPQRFYRARGQ